MGAPDFAVGSALFCRPLLMSCPGHDGPGSDGCGGLGLENPRRQACSSALRGYSDWGEAAAGEELVQAVRRVRCIE